MLRSSWARTGAKARQTSLRDVTLARWYSVINIPFVPSRALPFAAPSFVYIFLFPASTIHPSIHPAIASSGLQLVNLAAYPYSFTLPSRSLFSLSLVFSYSCLPSYSFTLPRYLPSLIFTLYDLLLHLPRTFRFFNVFGFIGDFLFVFYETFAL